MKLSKKLSMNLSSVESVCNENPLEESPLNVLVKALKYVRRGLGKRRVYPLKEVGAGGRGEEKGNGGEKSGQRLEQGDNNNYFNEISASKDT